MNTLTLHRPAHADTLQFNGEVGLTVLTRLGAYERFVLRIAECADSSMGDKLRALAALADANDGIGVGGPSLAQLCDAFDRMSVPEISGATPK